VGIGLERLPSMRALQMSVLAWIILGLTAGFIASNILNRSGQGLLLDIVPGIVVVVGGFLFSAIGASGITSFNLYSIFVAILVRSPCFGSTTPSRTFDLIDHR
jgi:uncharacterized membrane protein YeaQ/YmgE (transglycosylase-associated protein family)